MGNPPYAQAKPSALDCMIVVLRDPMYVNRSVPTSTCDTRQAY